MRNLYNALVFKETGVARDNPLPTRASFSQFVLHAQRDRRALKGAQEQRPAAGDQFDPGEPLETRRGRRAGVHRAE